MSGDTGLLGQIAADMRAIVVKLDDVVARLTKLETMVADLRADGHDHEQRLRTLELTRPQLLPRAEYESDRDSHARKFGWVVGLVVTVLVAVIVPIEAVWLSRVFG